MTKHSSTVESHKMGTEEDEFSKTRLEKLQRLSKHNFFNSPPSKKPEPPASKEETKRTPTKRDIVDKAAEVVDQPAGADGNGQDSLSSSTNEQESGFADETGVIDVIDDLSDDLHPDLDPDMSQINNQKLIDMDFPNLKVAHRISPNDKFYKTLQKDKAKYAKGSQTKRTDADPVTETAKDSTTDRIPIADRQTEKRDAHEHRPRVPSPLRTQAITLVQEPESIERIRETSPTPLKRKRNHTEDKLEEQKHKVSNLEALKKIKLVHSDQSEAMFQDTQPFDPDTNNSDIFDFDTSVDTSKYDSTQEGEQKSDPSPEAVIEPKKPLDLHDVKPAESDVKELKAHVLGKLTGKVPVSLYGCEDQYYQVHKMIENTITNQEGNSCLMVGPAGTGKRTTINQAIANLEAKYRSQFITVRLSGAVQIDENAAIKSIAQQIDNAIAGYSQQDQTKIRDRNSNRTLRALLKVLDQNDLNSFKTKSIDLLSVAVVFVIDEFHRFTEYNRQSLLYNLLDLSQNSYTPISVIGITTKVTTREMLEKRVKSRFSQKIIMFNKPFSADELIERFLVNCLADPKAITSPKYCEAYNENVTLQAKSIDKPLHKHLMVNYFTINSVKDSLSSYIMPMMKLTAEKPFPDFMELLMGEDPYSNELIRKIQSLSDLELALLLSCCRLTAKTAVNVVDFNACYDEYSTVMKAIQSERISSATNFETGTGVVVDAKIWSKPNAKRAWEVLQNLGLLIDNSRSSAQQTAKKSTGQNQSFTSFSVVVVLEELRKALDKQSAYYELTAL